MSEKLGIDRSYLSELESGKIEPCLRNLELIADGFGIPVDALLKGLARIP
jgi:transcriptional regulator with XRE-family HTH domain